MQLRETIKTQSMLLKYPEAASLGLQQGQGDQVQWKEMPAIIIVHDIES